MLINDPNAKTVAISVEVTGDGMLTVLNVGTELTLSGLEPGYDQDKVMRLAEAIRQTMEDHTEIDRAMIRRIEKTT